MGEYVNRSDALQAVGDIHPLDYNGQGIVERIKAIPAAYINENCPESREKSLALTKIDEAVMWANAAIARNE